MAHAAEPENAHNIADYDQDGYDYRTFWDGRDYEHWAERRVLSRTLARQRTVPWLVDLGGGFGRHVPLTLRHAQHVVLVDYSWTNLRAASEALAEPMQQGRVFLVRANLYKLPFQSRAFDLGMTVRVLHHLRDADQALHEMGRVLTDRWLLDVPIKHHLLSRIRATARGEGRSLRSWEPQELGTQDEPYVSFHLSAIRHLLREEGWASRPIASVANFRRWERHLPRPALELGRPVVYGLEALAQPLGRTWWGPSQWLWLTRPQHQASGVHPLHSPASSQAHGVVPTDRLASRLCCPRCHGPLALGEAAVRCTSCGSAYTRTHGIFDFVVN